MKYFLFSMLFIVSPLTQAQALCPMTSVEAQQSCLDEKLQSAIDHMVSDLTIIKRRHADNKALLKSLELSQQTWDAYRKTQCLNVYQTWQKHQEQTAMTASCAIELTRQRHLFLQNYYLK
ncbi:lysozyme inhibitor LprI family protein [Methylophaga sp.]|uniref:lysozyme inhibitor LprI family protein n=1 Tax=Methylophaga sp. TaxID=2024840 RepID=UPI003A9058DE